MVAFRAAAARLRGEAVCVTMDVERHPEVLEFFVRRGSAQTRAGEQLRADAMLLTRSGPMAGQDVAAAALPALVVLDKAANLRYPMGAPPTDAAAVEGHVRCVPP